MKRTRMFALALATVAALSGTAAMAAEHEVKMLNKGAKGVMVFEPDLIRIAPGDTVHFRATDASHNAETVAGMLPEGAEAFAGKMNKDVSFTFTQEGVYGIKCKPHFSMGMVAAVVVGDAVNLDDAKAVKTPGKAKKVFAELLGGL